MRALWNEITLSILLSNYRLEDIFNADKFGLFYQCLSFKTYHLSWEKSFRGRSSKIRLTSMAFVSAIGEKLEMFVISNSKKPRYFKNVKQLPCWYRAQKKSWSKGVLFVLFILKSRILRTSTWFSCLEIKRLFFNQWTRVSHKASKLSNERKPLYQSSVSNKPLPKISILQAMKHLVSSCNAVSKETLVNCFKKSNISQSSQKAASTMMTIHSKNCKRISRNFMTWIMMPLKQIYQLNHLLIWIVKFTHLLLSLMMISLPKLLKGWMKRVKGIKMMKKVRHQRILQLMKLKTTWKRCKTLPCSVCAGMKFVPLY